MTFAVPHLQRESELAVGIGGGERVAVVVIADARDVVVLALVLLLLLVLLRLLLLLLLGLHFDVLDEAQIEDAVEEGAKLGGRAPVVSQGAVLEDEPVPRPLLSGPARQPALLGLGRRRVACLVHVVAEFIVADRCIAACCGSCCVLVFAQNSSSPCSILKSSLLRSLSLP